MSDMYIPWHRMKDTLGVVRDNFGHTFIQWNY